MHRLKTSPKTVGVKETLKALQNDEVKVLYVAKDAQESVTKKVINIAGTKSVPIAYIDSMVLLGEACDVEVKTATAALIYK